MVMFNFLVWVDTDVVIDHGKEVWQGSRRDMIEHGEACIVFLVQVLHRLRENRASRVLIFVCVGPVAIAHMVCAGPGWCRICWVDTYVNIDQERFGTRHQWTYIYICISRFNPGNVTLS